MALGFFFGPVPVDLAKAQGIWHAVSSSRLDQLGLGGGEPIERCLEVFREEVHVGAIPFEEM